MGTIRMHWAILLAIFFVLNFAALGLGSLATGEGPTSSWYLELNKAPWTPPGWVFGAAWTTIMVCFSIYMTSLWNAGTNNRRLGLLYSAQWILNAAWSPLFFRYHLVVAALIVIIALTIVVGWLLALALPQRKALSLLILPYFVWLILATSLNAYIWVMN